MTEGEARTPAGRYVGADAFGAQDPSLSSSHGDKILQRCCGVYSASKHGTWSSSREATEHPSLHGAEDFSEKKTSPRWGKDGRCTCPEETICFERDGGAHIRAGRIEVACFRRVVRT